MAVLLVMEVSRMYVEAIVKAAAFTRPIHTVIRYAGSPRLHPAAASMFFVNSDGWALTCRHVAEQVIGADKLQARYQTFKKERAALPAKNRRQLERELERKHGFGKGAVVEVRNLFVNCVEGPLDLAVHLHPTLDVALVKFSGFSTLLCSEFPVFARDGAGVKQGKFLCRLGFPFPEFSNYSYDPSSDQISWNREGRENTPQFPIEGMVTRHLADTAGAVVGFELSTPGLRGQSGGPAFDNEGRIWGMQSRTRHLDLDFDVDLEVARGGTTKHIRESAVLHVGHCVHVEALKGFMRQQDVDFLEG